MRYSSRHGQKDNSSYNVGKAKGRAPLGTHKNQQDKDDYETRSAATTASTASSSHSDDERNMPTPPPPPAPTQLRTPLAKTKLTSGAALFVPKGLDAAMAPLPIMMPGGPTPGKESLRGVIEGTLGSEVWDLSMVDCQGFTGEWYTAVAITIPALSASMVHLATSTDVELLATAQLATQTQAVQSLMHSLEGMSPQMKLSPTEDASRLSVEYCGADRDKLCWEFSHFGQCPRHATCRWQHAMVETFLITIMLQPILDAPWGWGQPTPPPVSQKGKEAESSKPTGRWQPQRPPAPTALQEEARRSRMSSLPLTKSLPLTSIEQKGCYSGDDDEEDRDFGVAPEPKSALSKASTPTTPARRPRVGRSWADIQEDSDGDEVPLPSWN